jgi:uncharacterized damage-inducible protein DinB
MNEAIERSKTQVVNCKDRLLKTFAAVPDDKVTWSPSATAKSALRIAAHVGVTNFGFAGVLRGQGLKSASLEELFAHFNREEAKITSREQAVKLIDDSSNAVLAALDELTDAKMATEVMGPFGPMPMTFWMALAGRHADNHASQIDYLQTIWGDMEIHM